MIQSVFGQSPSVPSFIPKAIPFYEKSQITDYLGNLSKNVVRQALQDKGVNEDFHVDASVILIFDEEKLRVDETTWYNNQMKSLTEERLRILNEQLDGFKKLREQFESKQKNTDANSKKSIEQTFVPPQSQQRFGSLNVDIKGEKINQMLSEKELDKNVTENNAPPKESLSLSFSMPQLSNIVAMPFEFNLLDYLKSIEINLSLNQIISAEQKTELETQLKQKINAYIGREGSQYTFKITGYLPTSESWFHKLIDPKNSTISSISSAFILGILALIGVFMLSSVFKSLAKNILELKPKEEAKEDKILDGQWQEPGKDLEDVADDEPAYDPNIAAQALTAEMKTIRDQLEKAVKQMPQVCAELLRDFFYDQHMLAKFRDLLGFAGYIVLKPAMDLLPPQLIDELKAYIEDARGESTNLISGVEVAQTLYQDIVSTLYSNEEQNGIYTSLKESLLKIDDKIIEATLPQLNPQEIAIVLGTLTNERSRRLVSSIPQEKLKEAYPYLDSKVENEKEVLSSLLDKIELTSKDHSKTAKTFKSRRFIMKLMKYATLDDETAIADLIDPNDWDTKILIMKTRFLLKDLHYLDIKHLKPIIDGFSARQKAQLLVLVPEEIKNSILATLKDGSKLKDMLVNEMEQITKNENNFSDLKKNRQNVLAPLLEKLRLAVNKNDDIIKEIVLKQCEEFKLKLPDIFDESKDDLNVTPKDAAA